MEAIGEIGAGDGGDGSRREYRERCKRSRTAAQELARGTAPLRQNRGPRAGVRNPA